MPNRYKNVLRAAFIFVELKYMMNVTVTIQNPNNVAIELKLHNVS